MNKNNYYKYIVQVVFSGVRKFFVDQISTKFFHFNLIEKSNKNTYFLMKILFPYTKIVSSFKFSGIVGGCFCCRYQRKIIFFSQKYRSNTLNVIFFKRSRKMTHNKLHIDVITSILKPN